MDSRDTSDIYTGGGSNTATTKSAQALRKEEKQEKKIKLTPAGEVLKDAIKKERAILAKEQNVLIGVDTKPEDVKAILLGLHRADARIVSLGNKLNNLLREV